MSDQISLSPKAVPIFRGLTQPAQQKDDQEGREACRLLENRSPMTPALVPNSTFTSPSSTDWSQRNLYVSPAVGTEQNEDNVGNASACPFMSKNPVHVGDSQRTWSPYSSIISQPNSLLSLPNPQEQALEDPIAAEFRHAGTSSPSPSVNGVTSKCPIRFLDKHSPEELAEYFSHHKHEIPRSHEVCVRRYQSNVESIRELDAKYANLASLIQDLGIKHQPLLVTKEEDSNAPVGQTSAEKVEEWADNVKDFCADAEMKESPPQSERNSRVGVFDRPLKEVRVGESPSRPWGISLPLPELQAQSNTSGRGVMGRGSLPIPNEPPQNLSFRSITTENSPLAEKFLCPRVECVNAPENSFTTLEQLAVHILGGHKWGINRPETKYPTSSATSDEKSKLPLPSSGLRPQPAEKAQMIFTGPVFIGYSAEQAVAILQGLGSNPSKS